MGRTKDTIIQISTMDTWTSLLSAQYRMGWKLVNNMLLRAKKEGYCCGSKAMIVWGDLGMKKC